MDLHRRTYLAALAGASAAGLAGCSSQQDGAGTTPADDATDAGGSTGTDGSPGTGGAGGTPPRDVDLPVPKSELNRGAPKNAIPAITEPAYAADWSSVDPSLADDWTVVGVRRDGRARAYPLAILNWHEIVNDSFDGPLLVTYCPLCGSAVTAERRVNGSETTFGVSGYLWNSDLVMYDEATGSLWSQILATAIRGPETGDELVLTPSTMTTWSEWRADHPDTEVLLPPPKSGTIVRASPRSYERNPYAGYDENSRIGIGYNDIDDDRMHPKTTVLGVTSAGVSRAYPLPRIEEEGVVQDTVGDLPVVVTTTPAGSLVAYDRRVGGETLSFQAAGGEHLRADGSRWKRTTGVAVEGPNEGTELARANDRSPMFWFAWVDFHEDTEIYGGPLDNA
jgi:hypothetical protein